MQTCFVSLLLDSLDSGTHRWQKQEAQRHEDEQITQRESHRDLSE
ncbi:hypothetical protein [Bremerella sp.]